MITSNFAFSLLSVLIEPRSTIHPGTTARSTWSASLLGRRCHPGREPQEEKSLSQGCAGLLPPRGLQMPRACFSPPRPPRGGAPGNGPTTRQRTTGHCCRHRPRHCQVFLVKTRKMSVMARVNRRPSWQPSWRPPPPRPMQQRTRPRMQRPRPRRPMLPQQMRPRQRPPRPQRPRQARRVPRLPGKMTRRRRPLPPRWQPGPGWPVLLPAGRLLGWPAARSVPVKRPRLRATRNR